MATTTATVPAVIQSLPGRRYDHQFFTGTAILMVITVVIGFAPTYFLAGMFRAPLPSAIIHVHATIFIGWLFLLIAQTSLVSARRVDLHRKLGIFSVIYAGVMVILGLLAATDTLVRNNDKFGRDPRVFYLTPTSEIAVFGILIAFAFYYRKVPAVHKRFIYVANAALMLPAIARMPIHGIFRNNPAASLVSNVFLLILVAYDYWSNRKVYRTTIYASLFLIFVQQVRAPLSHTTLWMSFASWVQHAAHGLT